MKSMYDVTLNPSSWDGRTRPFTLDVQEWDALVRAVERTGYRPNTHAGIDRSTMRHFIPALKQVLQQKGVSAAASPVLTALLKFLEGPGVGGVTLTRNVKHWSRV